MRVLRRRIALAAIAAAALLLTGVAKVNAGALLPRGKKVFFGVSDTGDSADFGHFSADLRKHPALIESFRTWVWTSPKTIERWQAARARPVLHFTTADSGTGTSCMARARSRRATATST